MFEPQQDQIDLAANTDGGEPVLAMQSAVTQSTLDTVVGDGPRWPWPPIGPPYYLSRSGCGQPT